MNETLRVLTDVSREPAKSAAPRRADDGYSLTEVVITIALMGLTVVAVLASLQVSVRASRIDQDQAVAFAWLQAASDEIHLGGREPCTADGQGRVDALTLYDAAAQTAAVPPVWVGHGAVIQVSDVEYLGRASVNDDFEWSPTFCFEGGAFTDSPLYTQRVTIEVTFPDGTTMQSLEMVKSEK